MKKKSTFKTIIIILIALLIAAAIAFITIKSGKPKALPVDTESVARMDIEQTVEVKGIVEGTDSADVYSKSMNRIAEILVNEGERVKTGDNLARLEEDENGISLKRAQMNLDNAKRELDRNAVLYEAGAISHEEYITSETRFKEAEYALEELEEQKELYVTSPIDGTVTRIYASVGKLAGGNNADALFRIENIDQLQMRIQVSEYDITKVALSQEVRISSEITGKNELSGSIASIAPTGEEKSPGSGTMVIPVTVMIDKDHEGLFAGVNAKATIITDHRDGVLAVPVDAVLEDADDGSSYVFAVRNGNLHREAVVPIIENDFYIGIEDNSGLAEGDEVVLSPDLSMEDGEAVSINE